MESYLYELINNRQELNRIDVKVLNISKTIYSKDLKFDIKDETEKNKLVKDFQAFKSSLLQLKNQLDIIYRSTETKGKNYKQRQNPGLVGDIRGNVKRIKNHIALPVSFADDMIKICIDLSMKSGKRTIMWKATNHVAKLLKENKKAENLQASMSQPSEQLIRRPSMDTDITVGVEIITLIVAVSAMIKSYLDKKKV